jgi:protein-disulfide isomerase
MGIMTTKAQSLMKENSQQRNRLIIGVIIIVAVVAVLALILLSNSSSGVNDYSSLYQTRLADGGFVIGNPNSNVTLVEFSDYDCPACAAYLPQMDRYFNEYVKTGKAKFEYRNFPTHGQEVTYFIGQLVECFEAQKPGSYWEAKDLLFQTAMRGSYDENTGRVVASQLGVDYIKALSCSNTAKQIDVDIALANSLGIQSTPSVMVRYGDSDPQFIIYNDQVFNRGGVPYEAIVAAMLAGGVSSS